MRRRSRQSRRATDQFAKDGPQTGCREGALVELQHTREHLLLAGGGVDRLSFGTFDFADFNGQPGAIVCQLDDLSIEAVDLVANRPACDRAVTL